MAFAVLLAAALALPDSDLRLVAFDEPGFPCVDLERPAAIPDGSVVARDAGALEADLAEPDAILVWRHGSSFPAESWGAIRRFLERGGSLLLLGGEPFTHPVTGAPGARRVEPRSLAAPRDLRLLRPHAEAITDATLVWRKSGGEGEILDGDLRAFHLEPRFTDDREFPAEEGSQGTRDARLEPLAHLHRPGEDRRYPCAAAAVAIDRLRGRFAGGRWVLWLLDRPPPPAAAARLLDEARREPLELRATPLRARLAPGEEASLRLALTRPRAPREPLPIAVRVAGAPPDQALAHVDLAGGAEATVSLDGLDRDFAPGLHRIVLEGPGLRAVETGFLVRANDARSGSPPLRTAGSGFVRGDQPTVLFGTTLMSPDVHREFLFEPNPALWDDQFREVAALGWNAVRTGSWSGWTKAMPREGEVDEGYLRALEAYCALADQHGLVVIHTFFAFLPETWGGRHPYLDPASVRAQRAFVAAIARRLAPFPNVALDLINEPSFAPIGRTWTCRPSDLECDRDAFVAWLERTYAGDPEGRTWRDVVRARWRLLPDEEIGLPTEADFSEAQVFGERRPHRAKDYLRFAQDAFEDWCRRLTAAIRQTGCEALITVGQDEGGLLERPHPLMHAGAVDFTSIHTWWWNDSLVGSSRVDLQACKLEYSIVSPK